MPERCPRKDRETAVRLILDLMTSHAGCLFKPEKIAAHLGIGRERTSGLLSMLLDEGKVQRDDRYWFVPKESNSDILIMKGDIERPPTSEVRAWIAMGRELFGCPIKITLEVP